MFLLLQASYKKVMEDRIKQMIEEINPYVEFDKETCLMEEEVLDSVSLLLLITELETEFEIEIPLKEVTEENVRNIISIAELIKRLQA